MYQHPRVVGMELDLLGHLLSRLTEPASKVEDCAGPQSSAASDQSSQLERVLEEREARLRAR